MKTITVTGGETVGLTVDPARISRTVMVQGGEAMDASDGYHTFTELYDHRITLFIALCKARHYLNHALPLAKTEAGAVTLLPSDVWRSRQHADGTMYEGWFVMGIGKEAGKQISYHLPLDRWDETEFAETLDQAPEFDGHSPSDVISRLKAL